MKDCFDPVLLYIDPSTGGMLFSILFGLIGVVVYFFRSSWIKIRYGLGQKAAVRTDGMNIAIFTDHKRYWNIFEPILDELDRRGIECTYLTMSEDDPGLSKEYLHIRGEYIGSGNKAFARMNTLCANIVLSTTPSLDVFQWKRSKDVKCYVHIPHAASDITMYRMFGIDYYDSILLSGNYQIAQIRELERIRRLPDKELVIVGIPYMDCMRERLDSALKQTSEVKTILVAPSWGDNSLLNRFGEKLIDALINTGYEIVIRPHPQSYTAEADMLGRLMEKYGDGSVNWNRDNDNSAILNKADILISDFSGVIFDFALVYDKPVIYADTSFDPSAYDCYQSEGRLWTFDALEKIGVKLSEEHISGIKEIIDKCIDDPKAQRARDEARDETWMERGKGAVNVADYLENKLKHITEEVQSE